MLWTILCAVVLFIAAYVALGVAGLVLDTCLSQPHAPKHKPTMGKPLRVALILIFGAMCAMEYL